MNIKRTHDRIYLDEYYKTHPKEYFKLVCKEMKNDWPDIESKKILDIGCATGEFLSYLKTEIPDASLYGLDVMPELLGKVDKQIETYCADISNPKTLPNKKFDICTMMGVLSIFDNHESILDHVLHFFDEQKICLYLFGFYNPYDWDVLIKARNSGTTPSLEKNIGTWEAGWNYPSKKSILKYCESKNLVCEFIPFKVDFTIEEHKDDPLRSWTIGNGDDLLVVNGLQLIFHFYLCKIHS